MNGLVTLHAQLEEVLRTEAVATMAAYEAGKYQTQNNLDSCLDELRKVQATAEQQCQTKVQHIQVQYQQELEQLTCQYEEQVRLLETTTKERVNAAQVEAEEVVTQTAAHLLYTLQQQQQTAAEAAALAQASMRQGLSTDDAQQLLQLQQPNRPPPQQQLQHQQLPRHLLPVEHQQQQGPENSQQLQGSQPKQQQQQQPPQQHSPEQHPGQLWEHELEQHRHSWQQLEHAERVLQKRQQQQQQPHSSTPSSGVKAADTQEAFAAAEGEQSRAWQHLGPSKSTSRYATPRTQAAYDSISAPASVSASRRSSRARDSNTDAGAAAAHWHDCNNPPSLQSLHKPPRQLLRALSATEVLRRASSSRQQLQQGLLQGLRRASEASSSPTTKDPDSRNSKSWSQLTDASRSRQLHTSSSASSRTWEISGRGKPGMSAAAQVLLVTQSKQELVSNARDRQQRQSRGSDTSTPWLSSVDSRSMARVSSRGRGPVWSTGKPTDALDLLEGASD